MNITDFVIILSYMVFLSYSPGPNNILCSINGTKYGWNKTIPLITGMVSGFFLVGFITSLSIEFIKGQEDLLDSMKYFCAMYLLYLSYMIINDDPNQYKEDVEALESPMQFTNGFVLQFINGKVIIFVISFSSQAICVCVQPWSLPWVLGLSPSLLLLVLRMRSRSVALVVKVPMMRLLNHACPRYERCYSYACRARDG